MYAVCDRCGNTTTKTKVITSKKNGEKYTLAVCVAGCKSGKWDYAFFPPREDQSGKSQPVKQAPQSSGGSEAVNILRSIDTRLANILSILQTKSGQIPVQQNEMQPDDDFLG